MTFSSLTDREMVTTKRSSRGGVKVSRVIVHHWAGTSGGVQRLVNSTDKASAHYIILSDGTLIGSVPEEYRAWTSGSAAADNPSITVECQNSTGAPDWKVSDATVATLTRLIADVAKRYGFTPSRATVRGHREFAATACPGPYLYPRLEQIAKAAAADATLASNPGASAPTVPDISVPGSTLTPVQEDDMNAEQDARLKTVEAKVAALSAATEIVFFTSGGTTFEASLLAGTYRAFTNAKALADRKTVLTRAGVPYRNWKNAQGTAAVDNPAAFGVRVGVGA